MPKVSEETMLTVTCSWCGKDLGSKPGEGATGVTSGICDACLDGMFSAEKITLPSVLLGIWESALIVLGVIAVGLLARGYFDGWLGRLVQ